MVDEKLKLEIVAKAQNDYVKGKKYKDISIKYNIPINTLKSWRNRYGWKRKSASQPNKKVAQVRKLENQFENEIKEDLLSQINQNGNNEKYFIDLINDYMDLWKIKNKLIKDIKTRGVQVEYQNGNNQWGYKKNDSVTELVKYNAQMLKLLNELGLKALPQANEDDDDVLL